MPDAANLVVEAALRTPLPIVLIDGRSGSGKTELGGLVAPRLGAQLIRLDDLYPGWDGLVEGSRMVVTDILRAHRWRRWDWATSRLAEEHAVDPDRPLVIDGCGSLSRASRELATLGVWVELDDERRKVRALARDGEDYVPHWEGWAAQEQRFLDAEHPRDLADLIVDGATILAD